MLRIPDTKGEEDSCVYPRETGIRFLQLPVRKQSFDAHKQEW